MSILTSIVNKLRSISPELEDLVTFLQVIQSATKLGGASASTGLAVVAAALKALEDKTSGAITHEQFLSQIAQAQADLSADRQGEDAELAAKFAPPATP